MRETQQSINQVVAENLVYWMDKRRLRQVGLAEKAGVSQRTISNYLNPTKRSENSTGKEPSAKLTELDRIAVALGVTVWQLTRPATTDADRELYQTIEETVMRVRQSVVHAPASAPDTLTEQGDTQHALDRSQVRAPRKNKPTVRKPA